MKFISKTFKLLPLLFVVFTFNACSDDDDATPPVILDPNIVEIAATNAELTTLVTALQLADGDLDDLLTQDGPFTVLAPTNQAFADLLNSNPNWTDLTDIPSDVLEQVLLNHVISADLTAADLGAATSPYASTNAAGPVADTFLSIYFDTSSGVTFNGVSSVIDGGADIDASNGTIHIVDAVIGLPNIVTHATANPGLSSLAGALTDEGLVATLEGDGPFTVFAPDNDAFTAFTNPNSNALDNILLNHVIGATALSTGLSSGYVNTAATNADDDALSLYINTGDGVVLNGGSSVTTADIIATNGVIHVVSDVIDLPTVVDHAIANPGLSSLVAALTEADASDTDPMLIPTLSGDGPFTVFAPLNDAFTAFLDGADLPSVDDATLNSVLLHHVLNGNIVAADLTDGAMPMTLEGDTITINLQDTPPTITDGSGDTNAEIVLTDVQGINGVVHAINAVLVPDTSN